MKGAVIGSWIPDLHDSKKGSGDIDNHVFKIKPYNGTNKTRFIKKKKVLFDELGAERKVCAFLDHRKSILGAAWWNKAYKAEPNPGQDLANRSMALTTTLIDQLILGDKKVAALVPGTVRFSNQLDNNARSRMEEVATYCFMLSHFVADACQPCHCDARRLSGYSNGLHKEMEANWSKNVGTYFDKKKYRKNTEPSNMVLKKARAIDVKFDIHFSNNIPELQARDPWLEIVNICRASFAVASMLVPPECISYESKKKTSFEKVFKSTDSDPELLHDLNRMVMHDAVLNIAVLWKSLWSEFS
ncbi:MAG: hypothetical protein D3924_06695 [Candidatus Electrothrix sp. AR4]|nr:hypothetical protein [Candidatus Electrothrix sp. AR4]